MLGVDDEIVLAPPRLLIAEGGREATGLSREPLEGVLGREPLEGVLGRERGELDKGVRGGWGEEGETITVKMFTRVDLINFIGC